MTRQHKMRPGLCLDVDGQFWPGWSGLPGRSEGNLPEQLLCSQSNIQPPLCPGPSAGRKAMYSRRGARKRPIPGEHTRPRVSWLAPPPTTLEPSSNPCRAAKPLTSPTPIPKTPFSLNEPIFIHARRVFFAPQPKQNSSKRAQIPLILACSRIFEGRGMQMSKFAHIWSRSHQVKPSQGTANHNLQNIRDQPPLPARVNRKS